MYDSIFVSAQLQERKLEARQAAILRNLKPIQGVSPRKIPVRTAMSLSVAFAAGWLVASIF